jgi:hypothetical protein
MRKMLANFRKKMLRATLPKNGHENFLVTLPKNVDEKIFANFRKN